MEKNKVKFSPQIKSEFIIELRENVKNYFEKNSLSKYGSYKIVLKTIFMLLLYFVPYSLMLTGIISQTPLIVACWILMGIGMAGVGMGMMHDANHGTFSKSKKVNSFLSNSLYLLGGYPRNWQFQHNTLHHGFTNVEGQDEDIAPVTVLRFSPHRPLLKIHKYQHWYAWFFYGLLTLSWVTIKDFLQYYNYKKLGVYDDKHKKINIDFTIIIFSKIIYYAVILALPIIVLPIAWYWTLILFITMHFISGLILGTIFQTAHVVTTSEYPLPDQYGVLHNNWAVHQLLTTSNFAPRSRFLSWMIGGLNYQVEHHLFPNISHIHYRKLSPIVRETALKYNLPYYVQDNFVKAIWNHAQMLKKLGN